MDDALRPADCPPKRRLKGVTAFDYVKMIRWHERQAEMAMQSLCCGSDNDDFRRANEAADAHWCAAALMRLFIKAPGWDSDT